MLYSLDNTNVTIPPDFSTTSGFIISNQAHRRRKSKVAPIFMTIHIQQIMMSYFTALRLPEVHPVHPAQTRACCVAETAGTSARRSIPHRRANRPGRVRRCLSRAKTGDRRDLRTEEDAQEDAAEDERGTNAVYAPQSRD